MMGFSFLLAGCGWIDSLSKNQLDDIHMGQSPEDVRAVLGRPDLRSFDRYGETWEYLYHRERGTEHARITFRNGRVESMRCFFEADARPPHAAEAVPGRHSGDGETRKLSEAQEAVRRYYMTHYPDEAPHKLPHILPHITTMSQARDHIAKDRALRKKE